jgi:3-oxoadipate enol-lactonase
MDALAVLDQLKVDKAAFCGISMGAMVGTWLAMHHPRRFSRVALCNTSVRMPDRQLWDDRIHAVLKDGMEGVVEAVTERWFTAAFREAQPDAVERIRGMILATDPHGYAGSCAAIRDMDLRDRLGLIEAPAMIVIGAQDVATPPERGQYLVERIPGAQKVVLETAHLSNVEAPEEFNRIVLAFLAGERPGEHA